MTVLSRCSLACRFAWSSRGVLSFRMTPPPIVTLLDLRTARLKLIWLLGVTMSSLIIRLAAEPRQPEKNALAFEARRASLARGAGPPLLLATTLVGGCAGHGAPSFVLVGAFFPAWMLCALIGILGAITARAIFIAVGFEGVLPFPLFVCTSIGLAVGSLTWLIWFGQ